MRASGEEEGGTCGADKDNEVVGGGGGGRGRLEMGGKKTRTS